MNAENSGAVAAVGGDVDLFGAPITQIRERWGRPCFAKRKENQELVALLAAASWTHERIARYLGCDPKTLRKYFSRELEEGADRIEGMALEVTLKKMREGNGPAVQRLLEIVDRTRALSAPRKPAEPKQEPLGKKELATMEAQGAHRDTDWAELVEGDVSTRPN